MSEPAPHILFITKWYPSDEDPQMAIFVKRHAEAVSRFAHVTLLHVSSADVKVEEIDITQDKNLTTIRATWPKVTNPFFKLKRMFSAGKKAVLWIRQNRPEVDLVHCHMLARTAWMAQQFYPSTSYLITEHWTGYVNGNFEKLSPLRQWMYKRLAKKAEAFTVVSEQLKSALINQGFRKDIKIIPNVVEVPDLERKKNEIPHFLTVADFHEKNKNLMGILQAISKLKNDFTFHWNFIGDGEDKEKIESLAFELELFEHITFHGRQPQEEVHKAIASADMLVINSRHETFSMVTLESLMMGVPVIATRSGGPENFINEKNGYLIDTDDQLALEAVLEKFLQNPQVFSEETIKSSVDNIYNPDSVGRSFLNLYNSILKND